MAAAIADGCCGEYERDFQMNNKISINYLDDDSWFLERVILHAFCPWATSP